MEKVEFVLRTEPVGENCRGKFPVIRGKATPMPQIFRIVNLAKFN